jgi:hypothetical protein
MSTNKTVLTVAGLAILVAATPHEVRMAVAAVIGSDYWSELWPYIVVYLGALAGYFAGPDMAHRLRSFAAEKMNPAADTAAIDDAAASALP